MSSPKNNYEGLGFGERLRECRESAGMSVDQAARDIKAPPRYVLALEREDWSAFSAKVYAQGIVRRMARILRYPDADGLVADCGREWDIAHGSGARAWHREISGSHGNRRVTVITPRRFGVIASAGLGLVITIFLTARLVAFTVPPELIVRSPADRSAFGTSIVPVAGSTEKESSLTVNGRELTLDERGGFNESIELPPGSVSLHFTSRNRFGKTQTVVRNIFVRQ